MGLDITACSKAVFVEFMPKGDDWYDKYGDREDIDVVWGTQEFPGRAEPLPLKEDNHSVFRIEGERFGFRAGSYGGYNIWRGQLSQLANGVMPEAIWNASEDLATQALPFFELIHFSDCEGVIGSTAAKNLAKDFADFQAAADAHPDDYFRAKYADWRKAFELAADDGYVDFH